jgi:cell fate regulator YaaT (PSP1 superfamily)
MLDVKLIFLENVMQFNNIENNNGQNLDIEIEIDDQSDSKLTEEQFNLADEEKSSRFKEGEILTLIRVRFPGNARSFPFLIGKRRFGYGQKVVAMSDRGMTVGYINSFPYEVEFNKSMLPVRSIAKIASEEDIRIQKDFRDSEKKAEVICLRLIERHNLDMVLTHVEFIQFGKKAVFYFNAPDRVDFRELVKDLVAELKMRIELRQISVRDRAAALGAVGACGLQTCCSSFLKNYGNVSIKMAKNQNLALIPSKLNGVCGQIKCCIKYEDDVYADKRKVLPKELTIIKTKNGDIGKVLKLHLLVEQFEMLTDFGAKRRYASVEYIGDDLPENYKFPETFDHIVDETKEVIGLVKEIQKKSDQFLHDMEDDEEFFEDDHLEDGDFDEEDSSIENEIKDIEKSMKSSGVTVRENQHSRPQHNHNNNRNNNRPNGQNNRNNQNRNNDRNFKPRTNQENQSVNPNQNQTRADRPNPNRDNRNNHRPNNQQGGQGNQNNQNRDNRNNNNRNFKPRHNNQQRPNGGNQQQNNKEIKKPE